MKTALGIAHRDDAGLYTCAVIVLDEEGYTAITISSTSYMVMSDLCRETAKKGGANPRSVGIYTYFAVAPYSDHLAQYDRRLKSI